MPCSPASARAWASGRRRLRPPLTRLWASGGDVAPSNAELVGGHGTSVERIGASRSRHKACAAERLGEINGAAVFLLSAESAQLPNASRWSAERDRLAPVAGGQSTRGTIMLRTSKGRS
jgi:hypothetical protein